MEGSKINTHTHYLNLLILLAAFYPAGTGAAFSFIFNQKRKGLFANSLFFMALPLYLIIVSLLFLRPSVFILRFSPVYFYLLAILAALLCLGLEYGFNLLPALFAGKKPAQGVELPAAWQTRFDRGLALGVLLMVVGEEIIFRQLWFSLLINDYQLPIALVVITTAVVYGLNHLYFGFQAVGAKIISGGIYGLFYALSGFNILIPIVIHASQNMILLWALNKGE